MELQDPEAGESPNRPIAGAYPNIKQSFGLIGLWLLFNIVASVALMWIGEDQPALSFLLTYSLANVLLIAYARKVHGVKVQWVASASVPLYVVLLFMTPALVILREPIIELIPVPDFFQAFVERLLAMSDSPWMFVAVAFAAPVLEEVIFRGIILEGMLKNYSRGKALVWSSVLFGLIHLNPWQFISAFVIGMLAGWVYIKTRSLWPCIFIHFVNNAGSFLIPDSDAGDWPSVHELMSPGGHIALIVVSALIVVFGVRYLVFQLPDATGAATIERKELESPA